MSYTKALKFGSRGEDVKLVQQKLGVTADGIFGKQTENAVKASNGKMVLVGSIYGAAPYGFALTKGTTLPQALQIALNDLKADGTYNSILNKWGVQAGAVSTFGINGAIN